MSIMILQMHLISLDREENQVDRRIHERDPENEMRGKYSWNQMETEAIDRARRRRVVCSLCFAGSDKA